MDKTLSGATTLGQSGPENEYNEVVLHTPQHSKTGASLSDSLMSYPEISSASPQMQAVYSTAPRLVHSGVMTCSKRKLVDELNY